MAGKRFTGVKAGYEISVCNRGANQHSHVILRKTADANPENVETTEMNVLKAAQALARMSTSAQAYFASLDDNAGAAFLEKSQADQEAEVQKAKDEKKPPFDKEEKTEKTGEGAGEGDGNGGDAGTVNKNAGGEGQGDEGQGSGQVQKSAEVIALEKQIADLTKRLDGVDATATAAAFEKTATSVYKNLPIPTADVVSVLKAINPLPEDVRKHIEGVFKAHSELVAKVAASSGFHTVTAKEGSAFGELTKKAETMAKAENISFEEAMHKVSDDPANAELVAKADAEENGTDIAA